MSEMSERISPGRNSPRASGWRSTPSLAGDDAGEVADAGGTAGAGVNGQAVELVGSGHEQVGARDVFDEAEVAGLAAVLVHDRRLVVEQARAEDGDDAGVGVEERLARAVGAGVTQGHGGDAGLLAPEENEALLIDLGESVDGLAAAGGGLGGGDRRGRFAADWAVDDEVAGAQLLGGAQERDDVAVLGAVSGAFAVDGLRACDDYLFDGQVVVANDFQQLRGAEAVDEHVLGHLGHVAAVGGLVEDDVDVLEGGEHGVVVLDFALAELGGGIDPGGLAELVGVGLEIVEDADGPAFGEQEVDDVRADEACASGDEGALLVCGHMALSYPIA